MQKTRRLLSGFSLIEICLFMIIVGIMVGGIMPVLTHFLSHKKRLDIENKQEMVMRLLANYAYMHHRLPCPADPGEKGEIFGTPRNFCDSETTAIGIIPFQELGGDPSLAQDAYGHYMTYAISFGASYLAAAMSFDSFAAAPSHAALAGAKFCTLKNGKFKIELSTKHPDGEILPYQSHDDPIAIVLVSHGPSGFGAFTNKGRRRDIPGGNQEPDKRLNAADNLKFVDKPLIKMAQSQYDDMVKWATQKTLFPKYIQKSC